MLVNISSQEYRNHQISGDVELDMYIVVNNISDAEQRKKATKLRRCLLPQSNGGRSKIMYQAVFPDHCGVGKTFFTFAGKSREALLQFSSLRLLQTEIIRKILHQYRHKRY